MKRYVLDDHGEPVPCDDLIAWATWYEQANRRVASDDVGDVRVSTVFLGLDHNFFARGEPVLFETLLFGGPHNGEGQRYATRQQALAGHALWLLVASGDATPDSVREMEAALDPAVELL